MSAINGSRRLLGYLLHADFCKKKRFHNGKVYVCTAPYCDLMIKLNDHMESCENNVSCNFSLCSVSKPLMAHWKECSDTECIGCKPLREMFKDRRFVYTDEPVWHRKRTDVFGSGGPKWDICEAMVSAIEKAWHGSVPLKKRNRVICKWVVAVHPWFDKDQEMDEATSKLLQEVKLAEKKWFEKCESEEEYFQSIAEEIYSRVKEVYF